MALALASMAVVVPWFNGQSILFIKQENNNNWYKWYRYLIDVRLTCDIQIVNRRSGKSNKEFCERSGSTHRILGRRRSNSEYLLPNGNIHPHSTKHTSFLRFLTKKKRRRKKRKLYGASACNFDYDYDAIAATYRTLRQITRPYDNNNKRRVNIWNQHLSVTTINKQKKNNFYASHIAFLSNLK